VDDERFLDDRLHPHPRIQRRIRILKHHLNLAAQRPQLPAGRPREIDDAASVRVKPDRAGSRLNRPQNTARGRRFPATRLPHQRQRFPCRNGEAHIVDRPHLARDLPEKASSDRKELRQTCDVKERSGHPAAAPASS
jgi:hypothetical protein